MFLNSEIIEKPGVLLIGSAQSPQVRSITTHALSTGQAQLQISGGRTSDLPLCGGITEVNYQRISYYLRVHFGNGTFGGVARGTKRPVYKAIHHAKLIQYLLGFADLRFTLGEPPESPVKLRE